MTDQPQKDAEPQDFELTAEVIEYVDLFPAETEEQAAAAEVLDGEAEVLLVDAEEPVQLPPEFTFDQVARAAEVEILELAEMPTDVEAWFGEPFLVDGVGPNGYSAAVYADALAVLKATGIDQYGRYDALLNLRFHSDEAEAAYRAVGAPAGVYPTYEDILAIAGEMA